MFFLLTNVTNLWSYIVWSVKVVHFFPFYSNVLVLLMQEYLSDLQTKYNKLLVINPLKIFLNYTENDMFFSNLGIFPFLYKASSSARQRHLLTLRDYMQRCTNELFWMDQQAEERFNYDWSDTNLDYPARQRQYEVPGGVEPHPIYNH